MINVRCDRNPRCMTVGADLFPLLLSIITLVILLLQCVAPTLVSSTPPECSPVPCYRVGFDLKSENAFTARPAFEIPLLGTLTVLWLGETRRLVVPEPQSKYAILPPRIQRSILSRRPGTWACRTVRSSLMASFGKINLY